MNTSMSYVAFQGAMITACSDDKLHLWNLRQKKPEIVHSLQFQRERLYKMICWIRKSTVF